MNPNLIVGQVPQYANGSVALASNTSPIDAQGNFSIPVPTNMGTQILTLNPPLGSPYDVLVLDVAVGPGETNITSQAMDAISTVGIFIGIPNTEVATNELGYAIPASTEGQFIGKKLAVFGDSYLAIFGTTWVPTLAAKTGFNVAFQDGVSGRPTSGIFSSFNGGSFTPTYTNLYASNLLTDGSLVSATTGNLIGGFTGFSYSNYVNVQFAPSVVATNFSFGMFNVQSAGIAFYDGSQTFISGYLSPDPGPDADTPIPIPSGAVYMRYWVNNDAISDSNVMTTALPTNFTGLQAALVGIDCILIQLGTNDGLIPTLGSTASTFADATEYGYVWNALRVMQAAAPSAKIAWAGPFQYNPADYNPGGSGITPAAMVGIVGAMQYWANAFGVPFINLNSTIGVNSENWSVYLRDGVHMTDEAYANVFAPSIAQNMNVNVAVL